MEDVLAEVRKAADKGISEVTLLGQTVNAYKTEGGNFADLLTKVSEIGGIRRIRFTSPHPRHYTNELIDVLLNNPKVCHYAHIPIQSGSDAMLKKMRRQHNMEQYLSIIEQLRSKDPFYGISTDVICGFVGETEEDFEQTLKAFETCQFDSAFMFIYSPRKGTESYKEAETLTEAEKNERHTRLVELQNAITLKRNQMMLGRTEELLVEKNSARDETELRGRTDNFKKVVFKPEVGQIVKPGDYVKVKLDDSNEKLGEKAKERKDASASATITIKPNEGYKVKKVYWRGYNPGDEVEITFYRAGETQTVTVTLDAMSQQTIDAQKAEQQKQAEQAQQQQQQQQTMPDPWSSFFGNP